MSKAIANLEAAQQQAMANMPKVGGFPHLAETLRRAGVKSNEWFLPACAGLYLTDQGAVLVQDSPLLSGMVDVPLFDQDALIKALRTDQAGGSIFREFLQASWMAGVIRFRVDFTERTVTYHGCRGESYVETYPAVEI